MKKKKSISILLASMLVVTNVISTSTSVVAKENSKIEIKKDNYETMDLVQYVNPLIGTNNFKGNSEWSGTAPLVSVPFGMTNFTPQTRENRIGDISYMYRDTKFKGFFATHQPAIWMGDYGYVNVMPQIGNVSPDQNGRALTFSHDDETSTPYYYKVKAGEKEGKPITSEMTATERCAIYRFTYPSTDEAKIFVESARGRGDGHIEINEEKGEITGWNNDNMSSHLNNNPPKNLKGYFVIQFNKPTNGKGTYENYEIQKDDISAGGKKSGAYLSFNTEQDETIEVRIGTSFVSVDQARANIQQELGSKDFNEVKEDTKNIWNDRLNAIQIEGATESENHIFYTSMYHALLYPRTFYEVVDGKNMYFSPYDDEYHEGKSYTDFSLWDTFRAQNSLITLVAPDKVDEMVQSLLQTYQEGGYMPKWPNPGYTNIMIGTHADSIVAEAIKKGFDGFDYDLAYEAVLKDAMVPQEGDGTIKWQDRQSNVPYEARGGLSAYKALGYIPNGYVKENVSRTIEFAYDDWCVAQVAKTVGKENEAKYFLNRSMNYKNAINPETGYAMGRDVEGNWTTNGEEFTEGDRRKFTWFAPHDPQGLLEYMTEHKGADFYNVELEKAFGGLGGNKWIEHQNEPCHHYAYMFDFSGRPDLTQKYARQTLLESYFNDTSGQLGNDDCGQMSAWYVFSAMGFYPANPASGEYMIGSPIFDKVTINNPKTNTQFIITANNNNDNDTNENCYIQDAKLNGEALNIPVITYDQITSGGNVEFNMTNEATDWAKDYHKDAIKYAEDAESPEDSTKPPFFGDSKVERVTAKNLAKDAIVSATDYADPSGDIDVPSKSLIDGNYDKGYASKNVHSNEDLAKTPYYLTMEWDTPQNKITSFKVWSNYKGSQNPTKMDIEIKDVSTGEWKVIEQDWKPEWKDESGGDHRCSANIKFNKEFNNVTGLRIRIKEANFKWGKIAVRELEVFEDFSEKIYLSNPVDYVANIKYNGNKLEKLLFNGKELKENEDYKFSGENNNQITIFGKKLVKNGVDSGAKLEFIFSQGDSYVETLVIWDGWKSNLEFLVSKVEEIDNSIYTENSLKQLALVLQEAKDLLNKQDVTDKELEEMSNKLQESMENLVLLFDGTQRIEFEDANSYSDNIQIKDGDGETIVGGTNNTTWFKYDGVKFGSDAPNKISVRYAGADKCATNSRVEVRLDSIDGELISSVNTPSTGGWDKYVTVENIIPESISSKLEGVHAIYILLKGDQDSAPIGDFNWILFETVEIVDKTELDKVIKEVELLDSSKYTKASWDVLQIALDNAKAVYANENATKDDVNIALTELKNAEDGLKLLGDKTNLNDVIKQVESLDKSKYTKDSWAALEETLAKAKEVVANEDASQEDVDNAIKALETAINGLVKKANKYGLQIAVDEAKKVTEEELSNVVPVVVKEFKEALSEAEAILTNENATQEEVDASFDRLSEAMHMLSFKKGDKESLKSLIEKINGLDEKEYISKTWKNLQKQLEIANKVVADENALEKEVAKTYEDLLKAFLDLRLKPSKEKLEELINKAESIDRDKYTEKSVKAIDKALSKAKEVFSDEDATEKDITKAEKDLEVALNGLVEKDDNECKPGNGSNSGNSNEGKLPKTGGTSAAVGLLGLAIGASGLVIFKKKNKNN